VLKELYNDCVPLVPLLIRVSWATVYYKLLKEPYNDCMPLVPLLTRVLYSNK
jgi:hypothetical protein